MKKTFLISLTLILMSGLICKAQNAQKGAVCSENKVKAYYFHNTVRCATCKTVEAEAKADLNSLYGDRVTFTALNLDDDATKSIAGKLKVSGQTLLIVKGDQKVNLTNEGFLYAVTNPAKLKSVIKSKVDPLLNK